MSAEVKRRAVAVAFVALALGALTPWVAPGLALLAGVAFAWLLGNPWPERTKVWATRLLQGSVVGLGAGMNLRVVAVVGSAGVVQTLLGLAFALAVALGLMKLLRSDPNASLLIGVGTAICGGSAIAAVAPAIGAKSQQTSVALAVVFLLNAAALVVFPIVGRGLGMDPAQFGLWSALAIHDTSSVVGASMQLGPAALAVGTTVKLTRALWIVPVALLLGRVWSHGDAGPKRAASKPWFIAGFLATAALATFVPHAAAPGQELAAVARHVLVATLFLIGAGVSKDALRQIGVRPLVLGVLLWAVVAATSLSLIEAGVLKVPVAALVAG
jgi:uncharacterized integral membrane protein (TIGR00698 family)